MGNGHIAWKNPPHYDALKNYEWVDGFIKAGEIRREIQFLNTKKKSIRDILSSKKDMLERFKTSWSGYEKKRIEYLAKMLGELNSRSNDPFSRLLHVATSNPGWQRVAAGISWPDIESAIDIIFAEHTGENLTDDERQQRLDDLDSSIADFQDQIKEASPSGYFKIKNGAIVEDYRQTLVTHWRSIQGQCNAPCGPHGIALRLSPAPEQNAHRLLDIGSAVSKNIGAKAPLPQSPFEEKPRSFGMGER
jgi:hypothetical protein